jgi:hypothetical protein
MKHWDDILGKRLRGFRGKDVPGQADAIWDNIDTALGAPPTLSAPFWKRSAFQMALAIAAAVVIGLAVRQDLTPGSPSLTSGVERTTEGTEHPREDGLSASEDSPSKSSKTSAKAADLNDETATTSSETTATASEAAAASSEATTAPRKTTSATGSTAEAPTERAQETGATAASDIPSKTSARADLEEPIKEADTKTDSALPLAVNSFGNAKEEAVILPDFIDQNPLPKETTLGALRVLSLLDAGRLDAAMATPMLVDMNAVEPQVEWLAIRAFTGPTWSHFADLDRPDQSDYFYTDLSAGGGVMLEFDGARPWSIGLAWNDYVHNLQYTETTETTISTPGVVSLVIDIQTGDTLSMTEGDVPGVEQRTRYVDHHNRFRAFSIPLEWRQVKSLNRFQFGVGLGATVQIRSGASGRILNAEGLVVGYSDDNLSRGRIAVVPAARAFVGLRFAPAWRLDLGITAGVQRHASRSSGGSPAQGSPSWQGRLVHGQVQFGLSRFLSRLHN